MGRDGWEWAGIVMAGYQLGWARMVIYGEGGGWALLGVGVGKHGEMREEGGTTMVRGG